VKGHVDLTGNPWWRLSDRMDATVGFSAAITGILDVHASYNFNLWDATLAEAGGPSLQATLTPTIATPEATLQPTLVTQPSATPKNTPTPQPIQTYTPQPTPTPTHITIDGGLWISPKDQAGFDVCCAPDNLIQFAAHAYTASPGDPPIDHVAFTMWWPAVGAESGPWKTLCTVSTPVDGDVYECNVDPEQIQAPLYTPLLISFDVYDTAGNYNLSPSGERTISLFFVSL
jgi:hypothetical protein